MSVTSEQWRRRCLIGGILGGISLIHLLVAMNGFLTPDGSRDLAYGWKIANGQWLVEGPLTGNLLHLGPLYFYLLAPPLMLGGSIVAASLFVAGCMALGTFFAYRLGAVLFDWETGVAFALLFGVDYAVTFAASNLSNLPFLPVVSLGFLWAVALALKENTRCGIRWSFVWAAVALNFHLIIGTLFPLWLLLSRQLGREKKAIFQGVVAVIIISIPWLLAPAGSRSPDEGAAAWKVLNTLSIPQVQWFRDVPVLMQQYWTTGKTQAGFWAQAITNAGVRNGLLHIQEALPLLALGGVGLAVVEGIRKRQFLTIGFLFSWAGSFWLFFPLFLAVARTGYGTPGKLAAWYYYDPVLPLIPLLATVCCLRLPRWVLPLTWARRTSWVVIGSLAGFQAVAAVASFHSLAAQGFIEVRDYPYLPPSRLPFFSAASDERMTHAIHHWFPEGRISVAQLHGLPLISYVQNRGILAAIERLQVTANAPEDIHVVGLRRGDLQQTPVGEDTVDIGPFTLVKYRSPLDYSSLRFSTQLEAGWSEARFNDVPWKTIHLPTFSQLPQIGVYPPLPDMAWEKTPVYLRGTFMQEKEESLLLGVTFPAADVGTRQGRLCGVFVNGTSLEEKVGTSYLRLFSLQTVAQVGKNVLAVCTDGSPQMVVDLFVLRSSSTPLPERRN